MHLIAYYNPRFPHCDTAQLQDICSSVHLIPYLRRKVSTLFHWKPYFVANKEDFPRIDECISSLKEYQPFDYVLAESQHVLTVAQYCREQLLSSRLFLRVHGNEARYMMSVARSSPFFSLPHFFFIAEAMKYYFYDSHLLSRRAVPDSLLHISSDECDYYQKHYPQLKHHFLPAAIDISSLKKYTSSSSKTVLFIGALFAPNNIDALQWYLNQVHPFMIKLVPGYRFVIAGNTKGADMRVVLRLVSQENVEFHDTPTDLTPLYDDAAVFVNPMQFGAGVKIKTVNALLQGLPVVSTAVGNEGTGLVDGEHIAIATSSEEYKEMLYLLLTNGGKRRSLVEQGQEYLRQHYNQEQTLQQFFHEDCNSYPI